MEFAIFISTIEPIILFLGALTLILLAAGGIIYFFRIFWRAILMFAGFLAICYVLINLLL